MIELELELTYLAKYLPSDLNLDNYKIIKDLYFPPAADHPHLRLRQKGDQYEITKKAPTDGMDASKQYEHTIKLTLQEFEVLAKAPSRQVAKRRYSYNYKNFIAEIDVFLDDLQGLVLVDFEFENPQNQANFLMPDFCLADVTQENFIAGGMLAGKKYTDLTKDLARYNYAKI